VPSVIVWLNGAFGAGKSTTAKALVALSPRLRLFDPEWVGYLLRANLSNHEFTDSSSCRPGARSYQWSRLRSPTSPARTW